jgi:hypothetical protein
VVIRSVFVEANPITSGRIFTAVSFWSLRALTFKRLVLEITSFAQFASELGLTVVTREFSAVLAVLQDIVVEAIGSLLNVEAASHHLKESRFTLVAPHLLSSFSFFHTT